MLGKTALLLLGLCALSYQKPPTPLNKNSWALLVAGSNGWDNYRHQADICHAYHVMISEGIPKDHIVVMMYDDIANNQLNPTPGIIINKPNGENVYKGVEIDYSKDDVTPQNFLNILSGDEAAMKGIGTGRVIESNKNTNIFVYFADHGATGLLGFPNDYLYSNDLMKTLNSMYKKKDYNKFIFYVEACEAGSMFDNLLPEKQGVYAFTASARDESSYGWYCDWNYTIGCLGDEYSITWMEHMDSEKKGTLETFFHQYQTVRAVVSKSHAEIYGDFRYGTADLTPNKAKGAQLSKIAPNHRVLGKSAVNARDIPLFNLRQRYENSVGEEKEEYGKKLHDLTSARKEADKLMTKFAQVAAEGNEFVAEKIESERLVLNLDIFPCYKQLISSFNKHCFDVEHQYFMKHFYKFSNMCLLELDTNKVISEMTEICKEVKHKVKAIIV